MTISNRLNRTTLLGNGISTAVPIEFPFHSADDLVVIETVLSTGTQTVKVLTTHYTVTGTQDALGHYPTGGSVVMVSAPASTVSITVYRDVAALQQVILVENEKIPVKASIEAPLDRLTMIAQRLIDRVDRTMTQPEGDAAAIGPLPAKVVRASRYMGFDGDGNPTMMQTPTGMVTSIAQLTESTYAGLPAPGAAGTLRKVTDNVRGIWMDTGSQWAQLSGGVANVRDFGAKGDGVTDDTAAIQAAINAATGMVWFPAGTYVSGNLEINSKVNMCVSGCGATITWSGTAGSGAYIGFQLMGTCTNVTIEHLKLVGDGVAANGHAGVWNAAGQTLSHINTIHNEISSVVAGVSYNAPTGSFDRGVIAFNDIDTVIGTASGQGYGIHLDTARNIRVFENHIHRAQRHSIYHAAGDTGSIIHHNIITDHRFGVASALYRCAISIARSSNVSVIGNVISGHSDGGLEIAHDTAGAKHCANILVADNLFTGRRNAIQDVFIGEQLVPGTYETTHIALRGNTFFNTYAQCGSAGAVIVHNGRQIVIEGNTGKITGVTSTARFIEIGHDTYITDNADCDDTAVKSNAFFAEGVSLSDVRMIEYCADLCTNTSQHRAYGNEAPLTASLHYFDAAQTNPNLLCADFNGNVKGVYTAADTTPSVRGVSMMYIANSGAVSITALDDGAEGQIVTLIFADANTTVVDGALIQLSGGVNFTSASNKTLQVVKQSAVWFQTGGNTN